MLPAGMPVCRDPVAQHCFGIPDMLATRPWAASIDFEISKVDYIPTRSRVVRPLSLWLRDNGGGKQSPTPSYIQSATVLHSATTRGFPCILPAYR